jgi:Transposase, Mutator family
MATKRMDVSSFVGKLLEEDDVDVLRDGVRVLAQALMETEVSTQIGAAPYERSSSRTAYRNGYRTRTRGTRVGTIELKISKVTAGTYFPSLLEPRRRAEKALQAVVVEAYVKGVSTRKVDDLSRRLGSTASRSRRCPGSAKCSTRTSRRSLLARSRQSTPTSGSMRRSTRSVKPAGSCRRVCHMEAGLQILEQVHRAVDHPAARNFLQQHDVRLESNDRVGDGIGIDVAVRADGASHVEGDDPNRRAVPGDHRLVGRGGSRAVRPAFAQGAYSRSSYTPCSSPGSEPEPASGADRAGRDRPRES